MGCFGESLIPMIIGFMMDLFGNIILFWSLLIIGIIQLKIL